MGYYVTNETATVKVISINKGSKKRKVKPSVDVEAVLSCGETRNVRLGEGDILNLDFKLEFEEGRQ